MKKHFIFIALSLLIISGVAATGVNEVDDETVHIALSAPITGDWSEYGVNFQRSVELAVEKINADGGVLGGRMLRLSIGDTKGNPQEAATLAQKWTSDKSIAAQIGAFSSSSSMAAQPIYDNAGMVQLSPTASHADYAKGSQWSFSIVGNQAAEGPFNAAFAYNDLGLRKIAVLHLNNDWGIDTSKYFSEAFTALGGEIVGTEFYFDGESDFTAVLTKLKGTDADGLFLASFYNDGAAINIQRSRLNWEPRVIGPTSLYSNQLIELGGDSVDGLYTATGFFVKDPDPRIQDYVSKFNLKYNDVPNFHAALAFDAMFLLADAINRAGSTNRDAIRSTLAQTRDFPGLTGSITFTEFGDAFKTYSKLTITNGEFVPYE